MSQKAALLDQLRLERAPEPETDRRWLWLIAAGAAVVVVGVLAFVLLGAHATPVQAATAKLAAPASAAGGASLLDASGYIVAHRQATVSAKVTGKVVDVPIEEGDVVKEGQVIARLDDLNVRAALEQAKAQVLQAEANMAAAQVAFDNIHPLYERDGKMHARGWVSDTAYEQTKSNYDAARTNVTTTTRMRDVARTGLVVAERAVDDMTVSAPFAGVVTAVSAQAGEIVSPVSAGGGFTRTGLCTIVDMDSLQVEVDVSESFIGRVSAHQPVTIKPNAYPDWQIPGEVITVIPTADRSKATVKVRVALKLKDPRILPEMGARVSFLSERTANAAAPTSPGVLLPNEAVVANGDTGTIFVIRGDVLDRRVVRLGARTLDGQTVLSGIAPGENVVVGALDKLVDKQRVKIEAPAASP